MATDNVKFNRGDMVVVKHLIPNRPNMIVSDIRFKEALINGVKKDVIEGVVCFWFTPDYRYEEVMFSSKDLEKV